MILKNAESFVVSPPWKNVVVIRGDATSPVWMLP